MLHSVSGPGDDNATARPRREVGSSPLRKTDLYPLHLSGDEPARATIYLCNDPFILLEIGIVVMPSVCRPCRNLRCFFASSTDKFNEVGASWLNGTSFGCIMVCCVLIFVYVPDG